MNGNTMILILILTSTVSLAQENRSNAGIRPYPRDSAHEMTGGDRDANWKPGDIKEYQKIRDREHIQKVRLNLNL